MANPPLSRNPALRDPLDGEHVHYSFFCDDVPDLFVVTGFECEEALNRPYSLTVELTAEDESTDCTALLGRDVAFRLERGHTYERTLYGVVDRVTVHDTVHNTGRILQSCSASIVPALAALDRTRNTRIFQGKTALEIAEVVLSEGLEPYGRDCDTDAVDSSRLIARDYCVQYHESDLAFVHRLLEEEGIGYHFVQQDGPERLTLFDDNHHFQTTPTVDDSPVRYDPVSRHRAGAEPITRFEVSRRRTSHSVTVGDHDWTRGVAPEVQASADINREDDTRGAHEVYEHGLERHLTIHESEELAAAMLAGLTASVLPNGLPLGIEHFVHNLDGAVFDSFTSNNAEDRARVRAEWLGRDAHTFKGHSLVRSLAPGHKFELIGHPTLGADGEYYVTKLTHTSAQDRDDNDDAERAQTGGYTNHFECRRLTTPWRPDRVTHKPRIHSIQTAKVIGPVGMDIYTDPHGRVRVQFPWDRAPHSLAGDNSCWMRVSQVWAGQGNPGFSFIPRVGMEVVVAFIDGDPDRPLVTGCVNNGENHTPGFLPAQATKSMIRTRTVPHGPGYNEISFEDAMGRERVHIRAQRDLDELVLNNHTTDVRHHQKTTVGGDQAEIVGRHQRLRVAGRREVYAGGKVTEHSGSDYLRSVGGSGTEQYAGSYELSVEGGSAAVNVLTGAFVASAKGTLGLIQNHERMIKLASEGGETGILLNSRGAVIHVSENKILLRVGRSSITVEDGRIQVNHKTFPA